MIHDAAVPPGIRPPTTVVERQGIYYSSARWTPELLGRLAAELGRAGRGALASLPESRLLAAWNGAVEAFLDPASPERRELEPALGRLCGLSTRGLEAGLEAVLGGVRGPSVERLLAAAAPPRPRPVRRSPTAPPEALEAPGPSPRGHPPHSLVAVLLAANLPALAVQPLLPALALKRPVLLKSPSSEPLFAPAFVRALARRERDLGPALAAVTWPGGDRALEAPLLAAAGKVVAYGEQETLDDLARRAGGKLVAYGPKTSLAAIGPSVEPAAVAAGLARDVALFDQRGCLSIQAIYTAGAGTPLAEALAAALAELAARWPPGPIDPVAAAAVQQLRADARMRGLCLPDTPLAAGTVVVEPAPAFAPSPGLRTVRIHPLERLDRLPEILTPWRGRLQGAALAGAEAWFLEPGLTELGISRCAAPGDLQTPDALWHNGGLHPLAALGD